eukprot:gene32508-17208_t
MMRNFKDFFKRSSNGPIDGGGDARVHPASQEEIACSPQGIKGFTPEYTVARQSAPSHSLPTSTQLVLEHAYPLSAVLPRPPVQSHINQQIDQVMAQDQMAQQQMTIPELAQHHSVQQHMPQPFSNSGTQPFLTYSPTGECFPLMMPRPSSPTDKRFSPRMPTPTSEPHPKQSEANRHMSRDLSAPVLGNGMSKPPVKMLREHSLKSILSLDQYAFVPNVDVTTARLTASSLCMANSSLNANARRKSAFAAEPVFYRSMPLPSRKTSVADLLTMGSLIKLDSEDNATQRFSSAVLPPSLLHSGGLPPDVSVTGGLPCLSPLEQEVLEMHSMSKDSNLLAISPMCPPDMCRTSWKLLDFHAMRELHRGYASVVWQAKCKLTQALVVLKVYHLKNQCDLQRVQLHREIHLHSKLVHKNVVQFYSCFKEGDSIVMVLEFCPGGDLLKDNDIVVVFQEFCPGNDLLKVSRCLFCVQGCNKRSTSTRSWCKNAMQFSPCFKDTDRVVVFQELCPGGDLLKMMHKLNGRLTERQAVKHVMTPMLEVLGYLHSQGIMHRDIKPENVLFMGDKTLKLADFGLAIDLSEERANTRSGTLDYMAPEVLRCTHKHFPNEGKPPKSSTAPISNSPMRAPEILHCAHKQFPDEGKCINKPTKRQYTTKVDSWALGVLAYELVTGVPPYHSALMIDTARNITHGGISYPNFMSSHSRDFIAWSQDKDLSRRPTTQELMLHPWIESYKVKDLSPPVQRGPCA